MALVSADGAVEPVPDDAVASTDAFVVRRRQVRAAVDTLARALGSHGATYLRNVQKWESALVPSAPKLAAFPQPLHQAGHRLPATPPELHSARDAFVRSIDTIRRLFRQPAAGPATRAKAPTWTQTLSSEVRAGHCGELAQAAPPGCSTRDARLPKPRCPATATRASRRDAARISPCSFG